VAVANKGKRLDSHLIALSEIGPLNNSKWDHLTPLPGRVRHLLFSSESTCAQTAILMFNQAGNPG
jgi:hypothetical protein